MRLNHPSPKNITSLSPTKSTTPIDYIQIKNETREITSPIFGTLNLRHESHYYFKACLAKHLAIEGLDEAIANLQNTKICRGDLRTSELIPITEIKNPYMAHSDLEYRVQFILAPDKLDFGFVVVPKQSQRKVGEEFERDGISWKVIHETEEEERDFLDKWNSYLIALKEVNPEKKEEEPEKPETSIAVAEQRSKVEKPEERASVQQKARAGDQTTKEERRMEEAKEKRYRQKKEIAKEDLQREFRNQYLKQKNLIHDNVVRLERLQQKNIEIINKQSESNRANHKFEKA